MPPALYIPVRQVHCWGKHKYSADSSDFLANFWSFIVQETQQQLYGLRNGFCNKGKTDCITGSVITGHMTDLDQNCWHIGFRVKMNIVSIQKIFNVQRCAHADSKLLSACPRFLKHWSYRSKISHQWCWQFWHSALFLDSIMCVSWWGGCRGSYQTYAMLSKKRKSFSIDWVMRTTCLQTSKQTHSTLYKKVQLLDHLFMINVDIKLFIIS